MVRLFMSYVILKLHSHQYFAYVVKFKTLVQYFFVMSNKSFLDAAKTVHACCDHTAQTTIQRPKRWIHIYLRGFESNGSNFSEVSWAVEMWCKQHDGVVEVILKLCTSKSHWLDFTHEYCVFSFFSCRCWCDLKAFLF